MDRPELPPPGAEEGSPEPTGRAPTSRAPTGRAQAALDLLAPAALRPNRVRLRIGLGAAVVLAVVALTIAVLATAFGQPSGHQIVAPALGAAGHTGSSRAPAGTGTAGPAGTGPTDTPTSTPAAVILVHVLGAVARPGLFELPEGARVVDAVSAAGGLTDSADPAGANLARPLSDGEQLYLPRLGEIPPASVSGSGGGNGGGSGAGAAAGPAAKVNLNRATLAELDSLPRIGPSMAQRILDYRAANGPFGSIEELRNVTGIGDKTFEGLRELVTV